MTTKIEVLANTGRSRVVPAST